MSIEESISHFLWQFTKYKFIEITGVSLNYLGNGDSLAFICLFIIIVGYMMGSGRLLKSGAMGIIVLSLSGIIVTTLKHIFGRARPHLDLGAYHFMGPGWVNGFDSMPSGHSMASFTLAAYFAVLYPKLRIPLYIVAGGIAVVGRVFLQHHFISDVIVGGFLGIVLGQWGAKKFSNWIEKSGIPSPVIPKTSFTQEKNNTFKHIGLLILLSGTLLLVGLGKPAYWDRDESEFVEAAIEMNESNEWLTPTVNGKAYLDKPIFLYWTTRISYSLFGVHEFSSRLPSVLFGILSCLAVYWFGRLLFGQRAGLISALIYTTCPLFIGGYRLLLADPPFIFFSLMSFIFYAYSLQRENLKGRFLCFCYISIGLGLLSRGPLAFFPIIVYLSHHLWTSSLSRKEAILEFIKTHIPYILLAVFISAPWYIYIFKTQAQSVSIELLYHDLYRFLNVTEGHRGPLFYYVVVLGLGLFPWTFFLFPSLKKDWIGRSQGKAKIDSESFLLLSWFFSVFVLTSLCATKLLHYILPTLPPICCLIGKFWDEEISQPSRPYKKYMMQALVLSVLFILAMMSLFVILPEFASLRLILPFGILLLGLLITYLFHSQYHWNGFVKIVSGSVLLFLSFSWIALPWIEWNRVMKPVGQFVRENISPSHPVIGYFISEPSLRIYSGRAIETVEDQSINELLDINSKIYIITKESRLMEQNIQSNFQVLKRQDGFAENGGKMNLVLVTNNMTDNHLK